MSLIQMQCCFSLQCSDPGSVSTASQSKDMAPKRTMVRLATIAFFMGCMCGLMWQLVLVAELYFSYNVTTHIYIRIPNNIPPVATSFCTRFTDVLDFDRLNRETNRSWQYSTTRDDIWRTQDELSVREIFQYTPDVMDVIDRVIFRKNDSYERLQYNRSTAYDYVDVMKYVYLEHVCYRFGIKNSITRTYSYYAVTPAAPGIIYEIILSDKLSRSDLIKISLHNQDTLPYRSLKIQPVIWRQYDHMIRKKAKYNTFNSFEVRLMAVLLPAPFITNCFDYKPKFRSDEHCTQHCVATRSIKELGLVPFSILITNSAINLSMISVVDIQNPILVKVLLNIERTCSLKECYKKQCDMATTMTTSSTIDADDFALIATVPPQSWITVQASPYLNLVEFITYVMSTLSTWTGVSMMSFLPSRLKRLQRLHFFKVHCQRHPIPTRVAIKRKRSRQNLITIVG